MQDQGCAYIAPRVLTCSILGVGELKVLKSVVRIRVEVFVVQDQGCACVAPHVLTFSILEVEELKIP